MVLVKRKLLTFLKSPHIAIQKYFRVLILREILPIYNEDYNQCWGCISYQDKTVMDSCVTKWIGNANDIEQLIKAYPCDIAKVDIEGAETHIAKVSHKALLTVKTWLIETHTKEIYDKLTSLFLKLQFKVYIIDYDMVGVSGILLCVRGAKNEKEE